MTLLNRFHSICRTSSMGLMILLTLLIAHATARAGMPALDLGATKSIAIVVSLEDASGNSQVPAGEQVAEECRRLLLEFLTKPSPGQQYARPDINVDVLKPAEFFQHHDSHSDLVWVVRIRTENLATDKEGAHLIVASYSLLVDFFDADQGVMRSNGDTVSYVGSDVFDAGDVHLSRALAESVLEKAAWIVEGIRLDKERRIATEVPKRAWHGAELYEQVDTILVRQYLSGETSNAIVRTFGSEDIRQWAATMLHEELLRMDRGNARPLVVLEATHSSPGLRTLTMLFEAQDHVSSGGDKITVAALSATLSGGRGALIRQFGPYSVVPTEDNERFAADYKSKLRSMLNFVAKEPYELR